MCQKIMNLAASANPCNAMETGKHFKNVVNTKRQMSLKRFSYYLISCFLATSMFLFTGCGKDDDPKDTPNSPNSSVSDPTGTITANIAIGAEISLSGSALSWTNPDNIWIYAGTDNYGPNHISICGVGKIAGLGNITKVPASGYTQPVEWGGSNKTLACEVGHGYVIKIELYDWSEIKRGEEYASMFVVESIVSTADKSLPKIHRLILMLLLIKQWQLSFHE